MSIVINASACSTQGSSCPPPAEDLWMPFSEAWTSSNGPDQVGMEVGGVAWGIVMSTLLGLEGSGQYFTDRMTIWRGGDSSQLNYLDHQAMVVSNNYSVSYPGGASYTLDTGFVSRSFHLRHAHVLTCASSPLMVPATTPAGRQPMAPQRPQTIHFLWLTRTASCPRSHTVCTLDQSIPMSPLASTLVGMMPAAF